MEARIEAEAEREASEKRLSSSSSSESLKIKFRPRNREMIVIETPKSSASEESIERRQFPENELELA
jgi:hypothetical protein